MRRYIALVSKSDGGSLGASFPDFPGCIAVARDLTAAVNAAARALRLQLEGMTEDRLPVPEPRSFDRIADDLAGTTAVLIPLPTRGWSGRIEVKRAGATNPTTPTGLTGARASDAKPVPKPPELSALGRKAGRVMARRIVEPD